MEAVTYHSSSPWRKKVRRLLKRTPKNISGNHWCRQIGTCVAVTGLWKYDASERIVPNYVCYWKLSLRVAPASNRFSVSARFICSSQGLWHCWSRTLTRYSYSSLTHAYEETAPLIKSLVCSQTLLRGSSSPSTQTNWERPFLTVWLRARRLSAAANSSQGQSRFEK